MLANQTLRVALAASLLVLAAAGAGLAQPIVGVVDIGVIMDESLAGQEADRILQAFVAERQQVVDELQMELEELQDRIDGAENDEERGALQAEYDERLAAMRRQVEQFEDEINALLEDFRSQLWSDIQIVLQMFGSENGYDFILDASNLAYFDAALDVTAAVIDKYDELLEESRTLME